MYINCSKIKVKQKYAVGHASFMPVKIFQDKEGNHMNPVSVCVRAIESAIYIKCFGLEG